jgi:glucose/arabinose dehydrogenase
LSKASSLISLLLVLALALVVGGCGGSSGGKAKAPAARSGLVSIGAGLQGLPGLKATVYARGIPQMSAFAFDASGRLWVTRSGSDTHESDGVYVVASRGAKPVKVIPATLKGPLGVVWVGEKLYVSSLGRVTVFSGLSGHHFGRQTTVLTGPVPGGENNNLIRAPDGRLLMGISSTCDHCVPKSKWAAAIVSFRPDGSDLRIYARRIRAAYGLAFYPGTSDLFASMNQRDDLGAKTPGDWLAFVRQGDDWGFPACYGQGGAVCTNVPSPVGVLDTHAAAGSVAILTGQLGGRYRSSALVTEWEHGTVRRVTLKRTSTGYRGSVSTFLTGLQDPLPLATTADGSLLVGDWGRGIIYRIAVG